MMTLVAVPHCSITCRIKGTHGSQPNARFRGCMNTFANCGDSSIHTRQKESVWKGRIGREPERDGHERTWFFKIALVRWVHSWIWWLWSVMMYVDPCRHDMCKLPWGGSIQNSSFRSPTSPRFWRFFHKLRIRGITTYHNLATKKHFKSTSFSKPSRSSEVRAAIEVATTLAASEYDPVGCLATEAVKSFIGRNWISNEIPIEFTWNWCGVCIRFGRCLAARASFKPEPYVA